MDSVKGDCLLVIGAGVARTGTSSLKLALEILYKKPCYHLKEIYFHQHTHMSKWLEMERRLRFSEDHKLDPNLCQDIFHGYLAAVDHPVCAYYKELLDVYPNAKVVLTTRDPEIWLAGCRFTILPRDYEREKPWSFHFIRKLVGLALLHELVLSSWKRVFGPNIDFSNDTSLLNGFVDWNQSVIKQLPPDRLLVFDIGQGWEPLCKFLKQPIPDQPFPHVNEYNELRRLLKLEKRVSRLLHWGLPALLIIMIGLIIYKLFTWFF